MATNLDPTLFEPPYKVWVATGIDKKGFFEVAYSINCLQKPRKCGVVFIINSLHKPTI